jgi:hypothetical protein
MLKRNSMYILVNTVEDKIIAELKNDSEIINKVNEIRIENEDFDFSIIGVSDAIEYIEDFCGNLELVEQ